MERQQARNANLEATDKSGAPQTVSPPAAETTKAELPPAPHCYQITCKAEKDWRDRFKFWAEIAGLAVVIAYTTFAALQWCEMKNATQASNKNFRVDQRA